MGIGGGFIIVPAMIYILRMPTNVVMGTSLVQIIAVTAVTTVLQATSNYAVDIVLARLLVTGGVVGAQFGRAGRRQAARRAGAAAAGAGGAGGGAGLLWGLVVRPRDVYSLALGAAMRRACCSRRCCCWPCRRRPRIWSPASART